MDGFDIHPDRARLETLVGFSERRLRRATERQAAADHEFAAATRSRLVATRSLSDWIAANPDPQLPLPLAAAPNPTGEPQ